MAVRRSLRNMCALSDLKMNRLLNLIDEWARANGLDDKVKAPHRLTPTEVDEAPPLGLNLASGEIRTIIWATGYRPDYSWLELPVLDRKGIMRHDGGIASSPGLYLIGAPFLRRRKSTLIDGDDARDLSDHLAAYLHGQVLQTLA
jgi:putative flavoprotein involved in K+ transport